MTTITSSTRDYEPTAVLELTDRAIELPATEELLQLSDGKYTALDIDVDVATLEKFLSTFSPQSTIDDLAKLSATNEKAEP